MKLLVLLKLITFLAASLLLISCSSSSIYDSVYPALNDGKYDSEFPYRNSSAQLEEISSSVRMINSIAFYTSYVFPDGSRFLRRELPSIDFRKKAINEVSFSRTASGTATIIDVTNGAVVLLTVAHVVSFPDTLYSYFVNPDGSASSFVQSISIKSRQTNYIPNLPDNGELDVIAQDRTLDVALLGRKFDVKDVIGIHPFNYTWGSSTELEWGSFVYVFGFPMNYKMISKGIVSSPSKDKNTFLIDAVFNRGSSGGIVLGIRDGVPNFELVGLVRSVPAEFEQTLRPFAKDNDFEFNPMIPYKGEIYVEKEQVLRTGITKVLGIEVVKEFIVKSKQQILNKGFTLNAFFNPPQKLKIIDRSF
ncbi:MAG: serine protease [Bacteroidota bacterium]